jgi:hypothetical protein
MIIALSGYAGCGKDAAANFIRQIDPDFEIKKFSGKLKTIASILTGFSEDSFEDQEFKKSFLGNEWGTVRENPLNAIDPFSSIDFIELMSVREFLQKLGTDAIRNGLHPNAWVNALMAKYNHTSRSEWVRDTRVNIQESKWVITDCRFPNEAQAVKDRGGVVVRIDRSGNNPVNAHPSETALDDWDFDHIIINNGSLEDLKSSVQILLNESNHTTSAMS